MGGNFAPQELPKYRTGKYLDWLDKQRILSLAVQGVLLYVLIAVLFTALEYIVSQYDINLVSDNSNILKVNNFWELLYFNFITILTIGYGDYHPVYLGKVISIIESFFGVGLFTVLIAIITAKALLPAKNTIVFSKYAYFCTDLEKFLVIFVNTSRTNIVNAEISTYYKLGGDWSVSPSITAPFITQSVQTFYLEKYTLLDIIKHSGNSDCLRIGIAGDIGFTRFSTSMEYPIDKIYVIPNRDKLTAFDGFINPDFSSKLLNQMFHYLPLGSISLEDQLQNERGRKA